MKFGDFIEKWKRYRKGKCEAFKKDQDAMIINHINPILGHLKLNEIDGLLIDDVLHSIRAKGLSSMTERHVYNILNQAFRFAVVRLKAIEVSPVVRELHCNKVTHKPPAYLTSEKAWVLLEYTNGDPKFGMLTWLQTLAALRVGEAIGLRWIDVDFENNLLHIRNVWNKRILAFKDHTKNGTTDVQIPMIPALRKYLLSVRRPSGYVAVDPDGEHINYEGYKTYLRRLGPKLKLTVHASHGLRHTSTEVWMSCGASREQMRELLNHATIRSTERYIHRASGELVNIAKVVKRPKRGRAKKAA